MKKNYIAPSTQMATLASMGLMDGIAFAMETVSGCGSVNATISDVTAID